MSWWPHSLKCIMMCLAARNPKLSWGTSLLKCVSQNCSSTITTTPVISFKYHSSITLPARLSEKPNTHSLCYSSHSYCNQSWGPSKLILREVPPKGCFISVAVKRTSPPAKTLRCPKMALSFSSVTCWSKYCKFLCCSREALINQIWISLRVLS